jgi:hypothetical protein
LCSLRDGGGLDCCLCRYDGDEEAPLCSRSLFMFNLNESATEFLIIFLKMKENEYPNKSMIMIYFDYDEFVIKKKNWFTLLSSRCASGGRLRSFDSIERLSFGISDLGNTGLNAYDCGSRIGEELALKLSLTAKRHI